MKKEVSNVNLVVGTKTNLHPNNAHREAYDFPKLIEDCEALKAFVKPNKYGNLSIDFADPLAVKTLNKALLSSFYQIKFWDLPAAYLCPPIPGRADYIHHLAEHLAYHKNLKGIDIGVGANCIYPILGHSIYKWNFVGTDIDAKALAHAKDIVSNNSNLSNAIELRHQVLENNYFKGIIKEGEMYDFTLCNPPFHASAEEANEQSLRKVRNLKNRHIKKPVLNFGGTNKELWCEGGEEMFIRKMIKESKEFSKQVCWFSSLVSKQETISSVRPLLERLECEEYKIIDMSQGQKKSRILVWTFLNKSEQQDWLRNRKSN
ncbi:MAG: 23S rRNA (adenine(1618)-N(6))-methyltransferase RlmF [Bacteroidia bacterium]